MKFWLNGELCESSAENYAGGVSAPSAGLMLGWGVFTTLGVRGGRPRFARRHIERLKRDAGEAGVPFEIESTAISRAIAEVIRANAIDHGLVRLTLTRRGEGRWNSQSGADLSILALESPHTCAPGEGLRAQMSPFRVEAKRALSGIKTTSYLSYLWAWREAKSRGFDEAILRDGRDFWCEGARSTLFWVKSGEVYTPSLETGCLRGIGRELGLEWAALHKVPVHQGQFLSDQAERSAEIWLVSAASGPRPLRALHDENGALQAEFASTAPLCAEFSRWFEEHSE